MRMLGNVAPVRYCHMRCLPGGIVRSWKAQAKNQERRAVVADVQSEIADLADESQERLWRDSYGLPEGNYWDTDRFMPGQDYAGSPYYGGRV